MGKNKFILFANCMPVRGVHRSLICDLQNDNLHLIPNGLFEILQKHNGQTISDVKVAYENKFDEQIDEYFEFLISENLIFFNSDPSLFPPLDLRWESPSAINNIIIDFDKIQHELSPIIDELEYLKCSNVQFRFFKKVSYKRLGNILERISEKKSRITSIDFIIPFDNSISKNDLDLLLKSYPRIHSIILYNAPVDKNFKPIRKNMGYINMIKKNVINEKHCGIISSKYFYANVKLFTESQQHNTCLNKKISIDKDGNIKNCPSMPKSFGNITNTTLQKALDQPSFKNYWSISKDKIDTCKLCEFRHVCTDCRAYIEDPENIYSKPLKCGYDPHTNEWKDWSINPLKEKAIKHYGLSDFI